MGYDCRAGVSLLLRENPYGVFSCYQGFISLFYAVRRFLSIANKQSSRPNTP